MNSRSVGCTPISVDRNGTSSLIWYRKYAGQTRAQRLLFPTMARRAPFQCKRHSGERLTDWDADAIWKRQAHSPDHPTQRNVRRIVAGQRHSTILHEQTRIRLVERGDKPSLAIRSYGMSHFTATASAVTLIRIARNSTHGAESSGHQLPTYSR